MDYPGEGTVNCASGIEETAGGYPTAQKRACWTSSRILGKLRLSPSRKNTPGLSITTRVSALISPSTNGEMTKRGISPVDLIETYRHAGYEVSGVELPDYLPMVLEFMSACPEDAIPRFMKNMGTTLP